MEEVKKRGRKPKSDFPTNDTGKVPENSRLTEWEHKVMTVIAENSYDIKKEDLSSLDDFAKQLGKLVLDSMTEKTGRNWVKRTNGETQDFFIRFTLKKDSKKEEIK